MPFRERPPTKQRGEKLPNFLLTSEESFDYVGRKSTEKSKKTAIQEETKLFIKDALKKRAIKKRIVTMALKKKAKKLNKKSNKSLMTNPHLTSV